MTIQGVLPEEISLVFDGRTTSGGHVFAFSRISRPIIILGIVPSFLPSPRLKVRRHCMQMNISASSD